MRKQVEALAVAKASGAQPARPSDARPGAGDVMLTALKDLGYAEHRYDSRNAPMTTMCSRFGRLVEVLSEMAQDKAASHRDDAAWAKKVLAAVSGAEGFEHLVIFGLDCDFAVATQRLVRVQDGISADVSLTCLQVRARTVALPSLVPFSLDRRFEYAVPEWGPFRGSCGDDLGGPLGRRFVTPQCSRNGPIYPKPSA